VHYLDIVFLISGIMAAASVGSIGITLLLIANGSIKV
jgi:hypothetical protein